MIKQFYRWLGRVLPPHGLAIAAITIGLFYAGEWIYRYSIYRLSSGLPESWNAPSVYVIVAGTFLILWNSWRTVFINPANYIPYRQWLQCTPWSPERPLPFGPVKLVWQDFVLLSSASMLWWDIYWMCWSPLLFLLPYCFILSLVNHQSEQDAAVFTTLSIAALLPISFAWPDKPWLPLACTLLICVATMWGWRGALRRYPWEGLSRRRSDEKFKMKKTADICKWWPYVHPWPATQLRQQITPRQVVAIAILCGWISTWAMLAVYRLMFLQDPTLPEANELIQDLLLVWIPILLAVILSTMRVLRYLDSCQSPISLLGRFSTRKLVIPNYDRVFLAPIATIVISIVMPRLLFILGLPIPLAVFGSVFLVVAVALGSPPTLYDWRLTGEYRMPLSTPLSTTQRQRTTLTTNNTSL